MEIIFLMLIYFVLFSPICLELGNIWTSVSDSDCYSRRVIITKLLFEEGAGFVCHQLSCFMAFDTKSINGTNQSSSEF